MKTAAEAKIPPTFVAKKQDILLALATPDEYTDLSPKGSVDDRIRGLIEIINGIDGVVTTSSCAGRISVFVEGTKSEGNREFEERSGDQNLQAAVPGGKGRGGRWLFVSHDPVNEVQFSDNETMKSLYGTQYSNMGIMDTKKTRFVKFQFEPMILHIMTASLQYAQPILSAAINAGFRESGVQSLKNLDDSNAFPMVAIRSSGLAFGSLIGFLDQTNNDEIKRLVSEDYMKLLLSIANDRFDANTERINRLQAGLLQISQKKNPEWEDHKARRERKKIEGLERRARCRAVDVGENPIPSKEFGSIEKGLLQGLDLEP